MQPRLALNFVCQTVLKFKSSSLSRLHAGIICLPASSVLSDRGLASRCERVLHCGFNYHFSNAYWCRAVFSYICWHLWVLYGEMSLCPFFSIFLLLSSLYILSISSYHTVVPQNLLKVHRLPLHCFFYCKRNFILMQSDLYIFSFANCLWNHVQVIHWGQYSGTFSDTFI